MGEISEINTNIMKDLLKITHIKDDVCKVDVNLGDNEDGELLASALFSALLNGGARIKAAFFAALCAYLETDEKDEEDLVRRGAIIHLPTTKTTS